MMIYLTLHDVSCGLQVVELLESQNSYHGLYFYLGARIAFSEVGPENRASWQSAGARG